MKVFLSYTAEDLVEHADAAARAARRLELQPIDHRDWVSSGRPSVKECREKVRECDVLVVIVAHRYGWVPGEDENGDGERSITWLEVDEARHANIPVLPFLVEDDAAWPPPHMEGLRDPVALERLNRFKQVLRKNICGFFSSPESLATVVGTDLSRTVDELRRAPASTRAEPESEDEISTYRKRVENIYRRVELLGFGEQFQVSLPIDELYVPLRTTLPRAFQLQEGDPINRQKALERAEVVLSDVPLEDAFEKAKEFDLHGVVLLGDPGSGKTTAARRLAWRCADALQGPGTLGLPDDMVPVLLRLRALRAEDAELGLEAFLARELDSPRLADRRGLGTRLLERGRLLWILDGLDEVADLALRVRVSQWIQATSTNRPQDRFLVTSRYAGYEGDAKLRTGFLEMHVEPLNKDEQRALVTQWYQAVERSVRGALPKAFEIAAERADQLVQILNEPDFGSLRLASMVANPLLLSILCVVHRKDVDLPRRRADLYEKCVDVLLESWRAEWRKIWGRDSFDAGVARLVLQPLAWYLHQEESRTDATRGELVPVVEAALRRVSGARELDRDPVAFLEAIRNDSGLLVSTEPGRYGFLHLTFQEYLAARHAVSALEPEELAQHFAQEWWREPTLLALSTATRDRYAEGFYAHILDEPELEAQDELVSRLLQESLLLPLAPFVDRLVDPSTPPERLRFLLRRLKGVDEGHLLDAARALASHGVEELRTAARDVLLAAGVEVSLEAEAVGLPEIVVDENTGVTLIRIPAGKFEMGSTEYDDEQPVHVVEVPAFWMAQTPVTNAQYERFLEETGHAAPMYWTDSQYNRPDQPVVGVSWDDAVAYCAWAGFTLPSEAQWEYACRGVTSTDVPRTRFWSGNEDEDLRRVGWYGENSGGRLHAVAEKPANPFGLHDMHGNVWEWCEDDWSGDYKKSGKVHPAAYKDPSARSRVVRGGGFGGSAGRARSACRFSVGPVIRGSYVGFRPARVITE